MKKLYLFTAAVFAATIIFSACEPTIEKPKDIIVDDPAQLTQQVYADETQTSSEVSFTTTGAWTSNISETGAVYSARQKKITSDSIWVHITPESGDTAGNYTIVITLDPNYTGEDRTATITISCNGTDVTITVSQSGHAEDGTVPEPPVMAEEIILSANSISLVERDTLTLTATVLPDSTTNPTVIFTSENEQIATISESGLITAISEGQTVITAQCGDVTAVCNVDVARHPLNVPALSGTNYYIISLGEQEKAYIADKIVADFSINSDGSDITTTTRVLWIWNGYGGNVAQGLNSFGLNEGWLSLTLNNFFQGEGWSGAAFTIYDANLLNTLSDISAHSNDYYLHIAYKTMQTGRSTAFGFASTTSASDVFANSVVLGDIAK
ncbi:MAG: Ig-like domain-containing protein, partial [Prevotellaceae bacterium]|nr:Ig-like domain-containing protein [Prevotellaceae bacterium]